MTTLYQRGGWALPATAMEFKTGTWRVARPEHRHGAAPCHVACPAGEDAQTWLAHMVEGDPRSAWEALVATNPLPAVTGRVCDHPCETACNRGRYDEPIAIHHCERHLGDLAIASDWPYRVPDLPAESPVVAVIGAGPAGLSCAWQLRRLKVRPILFDRQPQAGGTLRTALPTYRLPRDVLDWETERLLATGIAFEHRLLGRDMSLDELARDYAAVFLAPGRQKSRDWSIDGATPSDLRPAIRMLEEWVAMGSVPELRSAAIVGGGNSAVDLARVLRRAGVDAHIVTHHSMPGPGVPADETMPAIPREIAQALEEGVVIHSNRGIRRLILRGGQVVGVEMVRMKKLVRTDGRQERVAFEGTESVLHVDQVIPAVGQQVEAEGFGALLNELGLIDADSHGTIAHAARIYAGGDCRMDSRGTVAAAVGDGRRAALALVSQLHDAAWPTQELSETVPFERLNLAYFEHATRPHSRILVPELRNGSDEIDSGLDEAQVKYETARCLSCGNCLACDNCWTLCPDQAVLKTRERASDGSHYVFDYDYCKGCGLCAHECPSGFIAMVDDA
ncbi:MAG: FAD-dependent oxidoreductase [Thiobacillaceae bacterium]